MTRKLDPHTILLEPEKPQQCDDCGEIAELRPYGPGGSVVCFECAMKTPEEAERQFCRVLGIPAP